MRYQSNLISLVVTCSMLLGATACGTKPDNQSVSTPNHSADKSIVDQRELFFSCREFSKDGKEIKDTNGETKLLEIKDYKDGWDKPMLLDCMAQGETPDPTPQEKEALGKVKAKDDDSEQDMGLRRVLAECASTTGYPIDGRSDTSSNLEANPFTDPQDAKDGYKVLAFCPSHPQAAKIKENADKATMQTQAKNEPEVPTDYQSALSKAQDYSYLMHMSKQGIYEQLTSEYGEKFSPQAAQYAVDHLQAAYKANAIAKANDYQKTMNMSPEAIRDQLTSDSGEKFTPDEANYAIQHLND